VCHIFLRGLVRTIVAGRFVGAVRISQRPSTVRSTSIDGDGNQRELVWAPVRGGPAPIMDAMRPTLPLFYSRVKVAANASSWPLSALRMADLISGLSSRTGPVILQSANRRTRVPSPYAEQV
jgi:hypothetical protein